MSIARLQITTTDPTAEKDLPTTPVVSPKTSIEPASPESDSPEPVSPKKSPAKSTTTAILNLIDEKIEAVINQLASEHKNAITFKINKGLCFHPMQGTGLLFNIQSNESPTAHSIFYLRPNPNPLKGETIAPIAPQSPTKRNG